MLTTEYSICVIHGENFFNRIYTTLLFGLLFCTFLRITAIYAHYQEQTSVIDTVCKLGVTVNVALPLFVMYSCCGESLDIVISSKSRFRTSSVVAMTQAR